METKVFQHVGANVKTSVSKCVFCLKNRSPQAGKPAKLGLGQLRPDPEKLVGTRLCNVPWRLKTRRGSAPYIAMPPWHEPEFLCTTSHATFLCGIVIEDDKGVHDGSSEALWCSTCTQASRDLDRTSCWHLLALRKTQCQKTGLLRIGIQRLVAVDQEGPVKGVILS